MQAAKTRNFRKRLERCFLFRKTIISEKKRKCQEYQTSKERVSSSLILHHLTHFATAVALRLVFSSLFSQEFVGRQVLVFYISSVFLFCCIYISSKELLANNLFRNLQLEFLFLNEEKFTVFEDIIPNSDRSHIFNVNRFRHTPSNQANQFSLLQHVAQILLYPSNTFRVSCCVSSEGVIETFSKSLLSGYMYQKVYQNRNINNMLHYVPESPPRSALTLFFMRATRPLKFSSLMFKFGRVQTRMLNSQLPVRDVVLLQFVRKTLDRLFSADTSRYSPTLCSANSFSCKVSGI